MSRLVLLSPHRPETPPPTEHGTDPTTRPGPLHTRHTLLGEWLSDGPTAPAPGIEALMDWVEGRT